MIVHTNSNNIHLIYIDHISYSKPYNNEINRTACSLSKIEIKMSYLTMIFRNCKSIILYFKSYHCSEKVPS